MAECGDHVLELENYLEPIFKKYGPKGVPKRELQKILNQSDIEDAELFSLIAVSDLDSDGNITFNEFRQIIRKQGHDVTHKLVTPRRYINNVVSFFDPAHAKQKQNENLKKKGMDDIDWGEQDVNNYVDAFDCKPPPLFIPLITIAEIAVFAYYAYKLNTDDNPKNDVNAVNGAPANSPLIYLPKKRYEAWRFLSYMFIHVGYYHIIFNCIIQIVLGVLLEVVHKFWRVGIVYIFGVIGGSLAHSVIDSFVALAGASGGVYALIGAHVATVIINWDTMQKNWTENPINFFSSGVFRLICLLIFCVPDFGVSIYRRINHPDQPNGITPHLGGFMIGLLVGIPVLRNLHVAKWEKVCFWISLVVFIILFIIAIVYNIFCIKPGLCPDVYWRLP